MASSLVVGLGRSGIAAAKLLKAKGHEVIVLEQSEGKAIQAIAQVLIAQGIEVFLGKAFELSNLKPWLKSLKTIVISPGIPWNHPTLMELRSHGVDIQGEMGLAWEHLKEIPWIGITGTNGKTTVTHLLSHVLETNGIFAPMGGNVGPAATELALTCSNSKIKKPNWLVMELSSYQIEAAPQIKPQIGLWTNLTPDHLERHGNLNTYRQIKSGLIKHSKTRIFNGDDPDLRSQRRSWDHGLWISAEGPGTKEHSADLWINDSGMVTSKDRAFFSASCLEMPGKHNLQNLLMVTAAALKVGLKPEAIQSSLSTFQGVPHRLEKLVETKGMTIFNDSKATNYEAASMGIQAVNSPSVVIAGGKTKQGSNPSAWLRSLEQRACGVILFGEGVTELKESIDSSLFKGEIYCCKNLDEAVSIALTLGQSLKAKSLLLSPACASFDQYQNFEERGEHFRRLISKFTSE